LNLPPPDALERNQSNGFEKHSFRKHIQNKVFTRNLKAFTLAEVLIALDNIGIIAAITVPTLLQKYQDQALKSALKKNYSVLKSALDKYQVDNGERLLATDINARSLKKILIKYFNVMTDCGMGAYDAKTSCIPNGVTNPELSSNVYKTYNGQSNINLVYFDDGQFVLNDGSLILIENPGSRIYISVDVNGYEKKPNRLGKDLFMFQLMSNGDLLPMGTKGTDYYSATDDYCSNTSTSNMNGVSCTAKVLRE
jgi:type II secretory pathway pseudopilin PulG